MIACSVHYTIHPLFVVTTNMSSTDLQVSELHCFFMTCYNIKCRSEMHFLSHPQNSMQKFLFGKAILQSLKLMLLSTLSMEMRKFQILISLNFLRNLQPLLTAYTKLVAEQYLRSSAVQQNGEKVNLL